MDNTMGEPNALSTFFVSAALLSISIFLLKKLGQSIQKQLASESSSSSSSLSWKGFDVLLLFALFLLGQLLVLQLTGQSSVDSEGVQTFQVNHPAAFIGLSLLNLTLSILAVQLFRFRQLTEPQTDAGDLKPVSFWLGSTGDAGRAVRLGILALLCWIPGHIGLAGLTSLLLESFEIEIKAQESVELWSEALQQSNFTLIIPLCFYGVVMAPVAEEILFRGVLFQWLRGHMRFAGSLIISSVVFALVHDSIASWLPIAGLGGVCAWLYHRSGQLLAPIATHAAFNFSTFLLTILIIPEAN